jgi:hypothetical protein
MNKRHRALLELIVVQNLPLSIVTQPIFRYFMTVFDPQYSPPCEKTLKKLITETFSGFADVLRDSLSCATSVCMTTDLWTASSKGGYLGVTGSWIDDKWNMQEATLAVTYLPYPHTAMAISDALKEIMSFWQIHDKVHIITTDNGRNMLSACELLSQKRLSCTAHTLNLVVQKGLLPAEHLIARVKRIIQFFSTPKQGERLLAVQKSAGSEHLDGASGDEKVYIFA